MSTLYTSVIFKFITPVVWCVSKCSLLASEPTTPEYTGWTGGVNGAISVIHSLKATGEYCRFDTPQRSFVAQLVLLLILTYRDTSTSMPGYRQLTVHHEEVNSHE